MMMVPWLTGVGDAVEVALSAALVASGGSGRRAVATTLTITMLTRYTDSSMGKNRGESAPAKARVRVLPPLL